MKTPPIISTTTDSNVRGYFNDAVIRTGVCVMLGIIGFWYPCWYDWQLGGPQVDSRAGMVLVWTLPLIFSYALFSTLALRGAYRLTRLTNQLKRSLTIPARTSLLVTISLDRREDYLADRVCGLRIWEVELIAELQFGSQSNRGRGLLNARAPGSSNGLTGSSLNSTDVNSSISRQSIQTGPAPLPSKRVLLADATLNPARVVRIPYSQALPGLQTQRSLLGFQPC